MTITKRLVLRYMKSNHSFSNFSSIHLAQS